VVGEDPPYLQAVVEWLADEEAAEEHAGDVEGLVAPAPGAGAVDDDVVSSVARGSLEVLVRNVGDLFARYVTGVAALRGGSAVEGRGSGAEDAVDRAPGSAELGEEVSAETAALLRQVGDDARALSFLVASAAMLTTEDRQSLLAESATRRRLTAESRLLRRELTLLREVGAVPVPISQFATPLALN
jgi:hypothetical protein